MWEKSKKEVSQKKGKFSICTPSVFQLNWIFFFKKKEEKIHAIDIIIISWRICSISLQKKKKVERLIFGKCMCLGFCSMWKIYYLSFSTFFCLFLFFSHLLFWFCCGIFKMFSFLFSFVIYMFVIIIERESLTFIFDADDVSSCDAGVYKKKNKMRR